MKNIFAKLPYLIEKNLDTMLVSIIEEAGSSPRGTGSQMLVSAGGLQAGTIGGGAVEKFSIEYAQKLISEKRSDVHEYILRKNDKEDIGMECGGDVTVFFQFIDHAEPAWGVLCENILSMIAERRRGWLVQKLDGSLPALIDGDRAVVCGGSYELPDCMLAEGSVNDGGFFAMPLPVGERVILFGGGHCALALAPVLHSVGFRITVMDNREEFVTHERYPMAEERICGDFTRIADYLTVAPDDYIVVMTTGHSFDYTVQEQVLRVPSAYVGVIGSRRKTASVNTRLREAGVPEEAIQSVHTPIGLSIKAVTPEEIAVSIAAEMILVRAELREKVSEASHSCPMH